VLLQSLLQRRGHQGGTVLGTLAASYRDRTGAEVEVLDAQGHAFGDPQASAVQQPGHEPRRSLHHCQGVTDFLNGQHDG
jgi:hypothetical protein